MYIKNSKQALDKFTCLKDQQRQLKDLKIGHDWFWHKQILDSIELIISKLEEIINSNIWNSEFVEIIKKSQISFSINDLEHQVSYARSARIGEAEQYERQINELIESISSELNSIISKGNLAEQLLGDARKAKIFSLMARFQLDAHVFPCVSAEIYAQPQLLRVIHFGGIFSHRARMIIFEIMEDFCKEYLIELELNDIKGSYGPGFPDEFKAFLFERSKRRSAQTIKNSAIFAKLFRFVTLCLKSLNLEHTSERSIKEFCDEFKKLVKSHSDFDKFFSIVDMSREIPAETLFMYFSKTNFSKSIFDVSEHHVSWTAIKKLLKEYTHLTSFRKEILPNSHQSYDYGDNRTVYDKILANSYLALGAEALSAKRLESLIKIWKRKKYDIDAYLDELRHCVMFTNTKTDLLILMKSAVLIEDSRKWSHFIEINFDPQKDPKRLGENHPFTSAVTLIHLIQKRYVKNADELIEHIFDWVESLNKNSWVSYWDSLLALAEDDVDIVQFTRMCKRVVILIRQGRYMSLDRIIQSTPSRYHDDLLILLHGGMEPSIIKILVEFHPEKLRDHFSSKVKIAAHKLNHSTQEMISFMYYSLRANCNIGYDVNEGATTKSLLLDLLTAAHKLKESRTRLENIDSFFKSSHSLVSAYESIIRYLLKTSPNRLENISRSINHIKLVSVLHDEEILIELAKPVRLLNENGSHKELMSIYLDYSQRVGRKANTSKFEKNLSKLNGQHSSSALDWLNDTFCILIESILEKLGSAAIERAFVNFCGVSPDFSVSDELRDSLIICQKAVGRLKELPKEFLRNVITKKTYPYSHYPDAYPYQIPENVEFIKKLNSKGIDVTPLFTGFSKEMKVITTIDHHAIINNIKEHLDEAIEHLQELGVEANHENVFEQFKQVQDNPNTSLVEDIAMHLDRVTGLRGGVSISKNANATLKIFVELNPLEVLQMGNHFKGQSCLAMDKGNSWTTITNFVEVNKAVIYASYNNQIIARRLICVTDNGEFVQYGVYNNHLSLDMAKMFSMFTRELAHKCHAKVTNSGHVSTLFARDWYAGTAQNSFTDEEKIPQDEIVHS